MNFKNESSYEAHSAWYGKRYTDREQQLAAIRRWLKDEREKNINYWIQQQMLELADPLCIDQTKTWLTVGDGYGYDAYHFYKKGIDVTASDISATLLPYAAEMKLLEKYSVENVERLSFGDDSFDFILCKEAYHHFPRPYLAVYEMLRVARQGIVLIEPQDPISRSPLLLGIRGILDRLDTGKLRKFWKNQYSFETVGNYVFKLSLREMEKLANGIGLPAMAVKGLNINFYKPEIHEEKADQTSPAFRKIRRKKRLLDLLSTLSLIPDQFLSIVLFKTAPDTHLQESLKNAGYRIYQFPPNPYLSR